MTDYEEDIEHLKNLIIVAFADGVLDEYEKIFLCDKAEEFDIPREVAEDLIANADKLEFVLPDSQEDREDELAEVVYMALMDGEMHQKEYDLCLSFAKRLELNKADLDMAIRLSHSLWLKSPAYLNQVNKYTNIILVASADEVIDEGEAQFLVDKAKEYHIPKEEAEKLIRDVANLTFTFPELESEKETHLVELIHLSLIDGELHDREYKLCFSLAEKMGISQKGFERSIKLAKKLVEQQEKKS